MWIIGIDEAGYGPNLGPFVMTAVACRVPPRLASADLWHVLRAVVRRAADPDDGRLLVADSKLVYSPGRGILALERGALVALTTSAGERPHSLRCCLDRFCPSSLDGLSREPWYRGDSSLPLVACLDDVSAAVLRLLDSCANRRVAWGLIQSVIICPSAFNLLADRWGSKGAVLGQALAELVQHVRTRTAGDVPLSFIIDKHGGRNNYAAVLQNALPDAMIVAHEEGAARSTYRALGLERAIRFTIQPRADIEHFCVALASMVSKYLREVLMGEFNRFWQSHVTDLKATAGYPGDSARFLEAIRPAMDRLGIDESAVWRRK
jgi:ribonuclease HII